MTIANGFKNYKSILTEEESKGDTNWRAKTLRNRIKERRTKYEALPILDIGKQLLRERRAKRSLSKRKQMYEAEYDSRTKASIVEQTRVQASLLIRGDQSWLVSKQLKAMKTSIRDLATSKQDKIDLLRSSELKALAIQQKLQPETKDFDGDVTDNEVMAVIPRKTCTNLGITADHEVNTEILVLESKDERVQECPKCCLMVLKAVAHLHIKTCKAESHPIAAKMIKGRSKKIFEENRKMLKVFKRKLNSMKIASTSLCPECGNSVLTTKMKIHMLNCKEKLKENEQFVENHGQGNLVDSSRMKELEKLGQMEPGEPTNLKVTNVTGSSISLIWEPPIFQGGYGIFAYDYLVSYSVCRKERIGKQIVRHLSPEQIVRTSTWCLVDPVRTHGFTLTGLPCGSEIVNIRVRAKNVVGISQHSEPIGSVETSKPTIPDPPLHVSVKALTTNSFTIAWKEPHDTGGSKVSHYEISYSGTFPRDAKRRTRKSFSGGRVKKTIVKVTAGPVETFQVKGLLSNSKYSDIKVRTITQVFVDDEFEYFHSDYSDEIPPIRTLEANRKELLEQEYRRVSLMKHDIIDSSVYNNNVSQRFSKADLLERLESELKLDSQQAEKLSTTPGRSDPNDDNNKMKVVACGRKKQRRRTVLEARKALGMDNFSLRKQHFEYRIRKLEQGMDKLGEEKSEAIVRRTLLTEELRSLQESVSLFRGELDRAKNHKGAFIDSSTLHGRTQRFPTEALCNALQKLIKSKQGEMARNKQHIIKIQIGLGQIDKEVSKIEEKISDRKAAFVRFYKEIEKKENALRIAAQWRLKDAQRFFKRWYENALTQKAQREIAKKVVGRIKRRDLLGAWNQWTRFTKHRRKLEKKVQGEGHGLGTHLLKKNETERSELFMEASALMQKVAKCKTEIENSKMTLKQLNKIEDSPFYRKNSTKSLDFLSATTVAKYHHARAYIDQEKYEPALKCFEFYVQEMQGFGNMEEQAKGYGSMGLCLLRLGRYDKAIVTFDRAVGLANECHSELLAAEYLLGIAQSYLQITLHHAAIDYADRALARYEDMQHGPGQANACRILRDAYKGNGDFEKEEKFRLRASLIDEEMKHNLEDGYRKIKHAEQHLITITADASKKVELEFVSAKVPKLRVEIEERRITVEQILDDINKTEQEVSRLKGRLHSLEEEINMVSTSGEELLDSEFVHGVQQRFKSSELLIKLRREMQISENKIEEKTASLKTLKIKYSNQMDNLKDLGEFLKVEIGTLAQKVMKRQKVRCVALNPCNLKVGDVSGMQSGGVERLACSFGDSVAVFDLRDGALLKVLEGDKPVPGQPSLQLKGHHGTISSLFYYSQKIYSGGVDSDVRCWDSLKSFECTNVLKGHQGTIWSLFADSEKLLSSSSDLTVRVWSASNLKCCKVLQGFHKTVRCIQATYEKIATGGADHYIQLWEIEDNNFRDIARIKTLKGQRSPVTVIAFNDTEIVSGGEDGAIVIWDISSGSILQRCVEHTGPIRCLQFDATKVVSASLDQTIRVFDIGTGACVTTLRGHEDDVLALQFDKYQILSVSVDVSMRFWNWSGDISEKPPAYDRMHIVGPDDSITTLEQDFKVSAADLFRWNKLRSTDSLYVGQRLIVAKGLDSNSDELTKVKIKHQKKAKRKAQKEKQKAKSKGN